MSYDKEQELQAEIKKMQQETQNVTQTDSEQKPQVESVEQKAIEPEAYAPKDEWEEKALKIGWHPDHTGQNFVDAKEYVLRKPLFERIERQTSELRAIKEAHRQNAANLAQVRKEAYDQALRDLENKQDSAAAEANTIEYQKYKAQFRQLNQQMQQDPIMRVPAPEAIPKDPEVERFQQHSWYNANNVENAKMKALADSVDSYLAKQAHLDGSQIDVKQHLAQIESEVRRVFPHRFESAPVTTNAPQMVGKSTMPTRDSRNITNLATQLTPQQRELGERFHRSNPEFTLDEYAKQLHQMGRLGK